LASRVGEGQCPTEARQFPRAPWRFAMFARLLVWEALKGCIHCRPIGGQMPSPRLSAEVRRHPGRLPLVELRPSASPTVATCSAYEKEQTRLDGRERSSTLVTVGRPYEQRNRSRESSQPICVPSGARGLARTPVFLLCPGRSGAERRRVAPSRGALNAAVRPMDPLTGRTL